MLEPRACARAVGMGLGVESSGGSSGLPWVIGTSLRWQGWCSNSGDSSTCVQVGSRVKCHTFGVWYTILAPSRGIEITRCRGGKARAEVRKAMAERYSICFNVHCKNSAGVALLKEVRKVASECADDWLSCQESPIQKVSDIPQPDEDSNGHLAYSAIRCSAPDDRHLDIKLATRGDIVEVQITEDDSSEHGGKAHSHAPLGLSKLFDTFDCRLSKGCIRSTPQPISTTDDADVFVRDVLLDQERELAIALVTRDSRGQSLVDPVKLQARLLGIAHVVSCDAQIAYVIRKHANNAPCYSGAVRIYTPGFSPDSSGSNHPVWPLRKRGNLLEDEQLWDTCLLYAPVSTDGRIFEEVSFEIGRQRRLNAQARGEVEALEQMYDELETQFRNSEEYNHRLREEIRQLKYKNMALDFELRERRGNVVSDEKTPEFQTLSEVIDHTSNRLAHVILLDNARRTAIKSPYQSPKKVWEVFVAMEECANSRVSNSLGMSVEDWFKEQGVEFAPNESKSTKEQYGDERLIEG